MFADPAEVWHYLKTLRPFDPAVDTRELIDDGLQPTQPPYQQKQLPQEHSSHNLFADRPVLAIALFVILTMLCLLTILVVYFSVRLCLHLRRQHSATRTARGEEDGAEDGAGDSLTRNPLLKLWRLLVCSVGTRNRQSANGDGEDGANGELMGNALLMRPINTNANANANVNAANNGYAPLLANVSLEQQPQQQSQEQRVVENNAAFAFGFFPPHGPDVVPGMMSTSSSMSSVQLNDPRRSPLHEFSAAEFDLARPLESGRGRFGTVYEGVLKAALADEQPPAEQSDGSGGAQSSAQKRRIAVKVFKEGSAASFETERHIFEFEHLRRSECVVRVLGVHVGADRTSAAPLVSDLFAGGVSAPPHAYYLLMEFLELGSLHDLLARRLVGVRQCVHIAHSLAGALAFLHADVRPSASCMLAAAPSFSSLFCVLDVHRDPDAPMEVALGSLSV